MKRILLSAVILSSALLVGGCIAIGTGPKTQPANATLGQQLVDLKAARDTGAVTEAEYEAQKAKLLGNKP